MDKKDVEKFFNGECTSEEAQIILEWFETSSGKQFLKEKLDIDAQLMERYELRSKVPELNSAKLFDSIKADILRKDNPSDLGRNDWLKNTLRVAALILVILTASLFTISQMRYEAGQIIENDPVVFHAEKEQHREIKLGDGTRVRLNADSKLIVSKDFLKGERKITLNGEAYFDVAHDPKRPFIIYANRSTIEVLGTAFNVRSLSGQDNDQVAVVDGKVSFKNASQENTEQTAIILSKGQYGYLDNTEGTIRVDEVAIDNYLSWKSGQLKFEELTLDQICVQLSRLYGIECIYADEKIRNLFFTAEFSNESLEKTLSVLALSLDLEYEKEGNTVKWTNL